MNVCTRIAALVAASLAVPLFAGGIAIRTTSLTDNGDGDGFADTRETVSLFLTIENTTGGPLHGVTLVMSERLTAGYGCLTTSSVEVGDLAPGEVRTLTDPFVFTVGDVDRTTLGLSPYDDLSVELAVRAETDAGEVRVDSEEIRLDLDLDVSGGSGTASFFESFEDGFGAFENVDLDAGRADPASSDGWRCQYNDPDSPFGNTAGTGIDTSEDCYMGVTPEFSTESFWVLSGPSFSPDQGRGFSGFHSLAFIIDMGPPLNWTTPLAALDAAQTIDPVHVAADATEPTLRFKHQVSFADPFLNDLVYDRGVVMVQVADDQGDPAGPWIKVDPYLNPYDQRNHPGILNCGFDPIDDGNDEDDFYSATLPTRKYGPSSTCFPERIFATIGETSNPFDSANVGLADGPGLQGLWGIGTWIESRVDLSRFRGRSVRVRFLASTLEGNSGLHESWESIFNFNPNPTDDGWWIDDVEITGLVETPASVVADTNDNSGLPGAAGSDTDGDGRLDPCDNCPSVSNADQYDADIDWLGDACDICPANPDNSDPDLDAVCGAEDNCPFIPNADQADADSDGYGTPCDCDDSVNGTNPGADEVNDGIDNNCSAGADEITGPFGFLDPGGDKTLLSWSAQSGANRYQVARSPDATFDTTCDAFLQVNLEFVDATVPAPGAAFHYLVRPLLPNAGSWGTDSGGTLRTTACTP